MGSLNDSFQSSNFCYCCCSLLISANGKTYKSAIKRPIKIRTHHVVRKHLPAKVSDKINKYVTGRALKFYIEPSQATKPCNNRNPYTYVE